MKNRVTILLIIQFFLPFIGLTQAKWDTLQKRNVIKFNPTPMLFAGNAKNITFSYERLIKPNQSLSLQLGYLIFPKLSGDTIANLVAITTHEKYGVNIAFDYRYYPMSRNRRSAPDGLYIGGYLSYYGFRFNNDFNILHTETEQNGAFDGRMNIVNLGISLGYQFIFWKRVSLDLLMFGPSLSLYNATFKVDGNLDKSQIDEIDQELINKLSNRFPNLKTLFSGETLKFTGMRNLFSMGFRYSIQIGFAF
jgi:hypothetical protein